jgi:UDP-2,3-diacylglucosamine pyrophosphatase LpxH
MTTWTAVRPTTNDQEQERVHALVATPPTLVLVMSDLHLGVGRNRQTGSFDPSENFFADEAFARLVEAHAGPGALLVLNGDTFDFSRVAGHPVTDTEFADWATRVRHLGDGAHAAVLDGVAAANDAGRAAARKLVLGRSEVRYGLRTDDYKSVWKLDRILAGHRVFTQALASWLAAGGSLLIACGNHDHEIQWPLVRLAIRDTLASHGASLDQVEQHLAFPLEPFAVGNVYIEHGHEYEDMTSIGPDPFLANDRTQLKLPLGTFMNRYFINKIERLDPFLDNVKPANGAVIAILKRRPLRALGWWFMAGRFIRRAIATGNFGTAAAVLLYMATLAIPLAVIALVLLDRFLPGQVAAILDLLPFQSRGGRAGGTVLGLLAPVLAPYVLGALMEIRNRLRPPANALLRGATARLAEVFPPDAAPARAYATMGHTHAPGVWTVPGTPDRLYVNTGTWVPVWPQNRPDLIGRVVYTYARFELEPSGEYRHELLEWDEHPAGARPAVTFAEATA